MTTVYKFKAYYTDSGVGAVQDPAPTCTVINMADDSKLADAQATTASTNMPGLYSYEYSGNDGLDCVAWFKTTDTGCDVKELASYVSEKITTNLNADVAGVETKLDTVDTNVDSILADTGTDGVVLASGAITAAVIATDAIDADSIKADAITEIQNGLATAAALDAVDNFLDTEIAAILEDTGTTLPATLASILEDTGTTLPAAIAAVGGGAGGTSKVYTVTDSVSGLPIADVHVWVSTDAAGANVVASGYTDVSGQVTFMLDAATYYIWRMKAGYNFTNPDTEVVA